LLHNWAKVDVDGREAQASPDRNRRTGLRVGGRLRDELHRANISPEGAAIDVENPAFVPSRFRLVMASDSSVRECRVAWIQKNRIGLTFVDVP